jgi:alpha-L-arabinofuranosidase
MKGKMCFLCVFLLILYVTGSNITAQEITEISVLADKPGSDIQPTMWGVFFEDINFAADGGIYAELVKNRSFEFELPLTGWEMLATHNGNGRMVANFYSPARPANTHFRQIFIDPYTKVAVKETLKSGSKDDFNTIANPRFVYPVSAPVKMSGRKISTEVEPLSINVYIIDFKLQ